MTNTNTTELFAGLTNLVSNNMETVINTEENTEKEVSFTLEELETKMKPLEDTTEKTEIDLIKEAKAKGTKVDPKIEKTPEEIAAETENVEDKEDTTGTETDDTKLEVYSSLSALLREEGVLDKDFTSMDEMFTLFSEKVTAEANELLNEELESRPEELQELIKNYKEGVPFDELLKTKSNQMRYSNIELSKIEEDEDLQKELVTEYLKKTTKFSEDKIKKEVKRLSDLGELSDEAKGAKTELVALEKEFEANLKKETKVRQETERKENEKIVKEIHKQVASVREVIPGIKVTEKESNELFKMITTPVEIRGNQPVSYAMQVREQDPIKFDLTLNYLIKQGAFEGKWDFVSKKATTKAVSNLEKQVEEAAAKLINKGGKPADIQDNDKSKRTISGLESAMTKLKKERMQ